MQLRRLNLLIDDENLLLKMGVKAHLPDFVHFEMSSSGLDGSIIRAGRFIASKLATITVEMKEMATQIYNMHQCSCLSLIFDHEPFQHPPCPNCSTSIETTTMWPMLYPASFDLLRGVTRFGWSAKLKKFASKRNTSTKFDRQYCL